MTDLHDTAVKQAIRVLVDHCVIRAEDIDFRSRNHIADPDTIAEMRQDVEDINRAVQFLRDSDMVGSRSGVADSFIQHIKERL